MLELTVGLEPSRPAVPSFHLTVEGYQDLGYDYPLGPIHRLLHTATARVFLQALKTPTMGPGMSVATQFTRDRGKGNKPERPD